MLPESMNKSNRKVTIMVIAIISGMSIMGLTFWCIIWKRESKRRGEHVIDMDGFLFSFTLKIMQYLRLS